MGGTEGRSDTAPGADASLWRRAQHGWPVGSPLVQFPNPPLLVALAGLLVAAVSSGDVRDHAQATFWAGLAAWAWLELTDGANAVRRLMGAAGFLLVIVRIAAALGG